MRILHTILSSGFAGTERATAEMCNALCATHEVLLVVRRAHRAASGASILDHLDPKVAVREIGNWFPGPALRRTIREWRPEVIHAHLRRSTRLLARLRPPCPTISTLHMWVNGPHFLQMDGLIVIAQWQKRDLANYRGRVFDINESLVPHPRLDRARIAALRAEAGAAPGEWLVGGVGRLAKSKGFDTLIAAFREAAPPRAKLALVGDGRERAALEQLAQGLPVRFMGFRGDAKDFYQAFDLFVSPSRSEPLGRVLFEALDAGVPVLATRTQGPSEILARYPGRLVPIDDVAAMAAALREVAAAPPLRAAHNLSAYHLENVCRKTEAAYRELIASRAKIY